MSDFTTCSATEDGSCYFSPKIDSLTAERDAAVRELNAIRGEHTPGEAYTLTNPRPSLAGAIAADNERLKAELAEMKRVDNARIEECAQIPSLRADNERLRAELESLEMNGGMQVLSLRDDVTRLEADNERLRADRDDWKASADTAEAQLAELREAAGAYVAVAPWSDDAADQREALRAVLAKVTP